VRGLAGQTGNAVDEFVTDALRNDLLGLPLDLAALNLARGRDTGIPPLNDVRRQFFEATDGDERLEPYESWNDFGEALRHPESLVNFVAAYGTHETIAGAETAEAKRAAATALVLGGEGAPEDRLEFLASDAAGSGVDDIDFWIGGLAEEPFGEGLLGPSFGYVFETQLESLQAGDRFYYPHRTAGLNFFNQLQESSFAELIMANTDATGLQADVFAAPGSGNPSIWGDDAANALAGKAGNDAIMALGGDDTITDPSGDDRLEGGAGNDRIEAVPGTDKVFGGSGDDHILAGGDTILGGLGNDTIFAGDGSTTIQGNEGDDWIQGGATDDVISGDNHDPMQRELGGDDTLIGLGGDDVLEGEHGDDLAIFMDEMENYEVTANADGSLTVAHLGGDGGDGTDTLTGIERLQFAGETVTAGDLLLA
jgi:Ca2+-binding RTX toxin-like protein